MSHLLPAVAPLFFAAMHSINDVQEIVAYDVQEAVARSCAMTRNDVCSSAVRALVICMARSVKMPI